MFYLVRGWRRFLKSPGSMFRGWHFLISWGSDASPREPDAGLSSGALRAPELKTASGMPARFARRLRRKFFLISVSIFLCLGSQFLVMFLRIFVILGSDFSYSAFSYCVSRVYTAAADFKSRIDEENTKSPPHSHFLVRVWPARVRIS